MYGKLILSEFGEIPPLLSGTTESEEVPGHPHGGDSNGVDSIEDMNISYGLDDADGGSDGICDFEGIDGVAYSDLAAIPSGDVGDQLTLSYCGQVYVFDNVTTDKLQKVFLLLGGCEFPVGQQGAELAYQNQRDFDYLGRCGDPRRAPSLSRFRQKRKERCFGKKIRYNVRQEVALSKGVISHLWLAGVSSVCFFSAKIGIWYPKPQGTMRDLSKKFNDHSSSLAQQLYNCKDEYMSRCSAAAAELGLRQLIMTHTTPRASLAYMLQYTGF